MRTPPGTGFSESVSGGTVQSLVEVLRDPDPARTGDVAARLPDPAPGSGTAADPDAVRAFSPLRLRARTADGKTATGVTSAPVAWASVAVSIVQSRLTSAGVRVRRVGTIAMSSKL